MKATCQGNSRRSRCVYPVDVKWQCDEQKPTCRLCAVSDRRCSFSSRIRHATSKHLTSPVPSPPSGSGSLGSSSPLSHDTAPPLSATTKPKISDDPINLTHMALLIHATQEDSDLFDLAGGTRGHNHTSLVIGLNLALRTPYLMHQLLAFSAQHLAHTQPENQAHYLHHAVALQTQAISLFNASWTGVDAATCVPIVLFTSLLGHQVLAETLRTRERGLDAFIARYVQCTGTNRGIYVVATAAWPVLMESELEPVLSLSQRFTSRDPVGKHCRPLEDLVDLAIDMAEDDKEACLSAIRYLQVGFDAVVAEGEVVNRHQMICSWPMLVEPPFTELLVKKRPEAVLILAYYAVLLHHGRELWQCGGAGMYVLELIARDLGPPWRAEEIVELANDGTGKVGKRLLLHYALSASGKDSS